MKQISLSIDVDDETKALAEQVCDKLELSLATAITIFLNKVGREQRIPFEVSTNPSYGDENVAKP